MAVDPTQSPTADELELARRTFDEKESHDLFYRVATELVGLALNRETRITVTDALAVLLQTWNQSFYRFRKFDDQHFADIERLLATHLDTIRALRQRTIESLSDQDDAIVERLFDDFEHVAGPVGAAKCLHLLAPRFFPLWDRTIAEAYGLALGIRGTNAQLYAAFMYITALQCQRLGGEAALGRNPLKAIDEYNYCHYTRRWM